MSFVADVPTLLAMLGAPLSPAEEALLGELLGAVRRHVAHRAPAAAAPSPEADLELALAERTVALFRRRQAPEARETGWDEFQSQALAQLDTDRDFQRLVAPHLDWSQAGVG